MGLGWVLKAIGIRVVILHVVVVVLGLLLVQMRRVGWAALVIHHHVVAGFLHGATREQLLDLERLFYQYILDIVREVIYLVLLGMGLQLAGLLMLGRELELQLFELGLIPEVVA